MRSSDLLTTNHTYFFIIIILIGAAAMRCRLRYANVVARTWAAFRKEWNLNQDWTFANLCQTSFDTVWHRGSLSALAFRAVFMIFTSDSTGFWSDRTLMRLALVLKNSNTPNRDNRNFTTVLTTYQPDSVWAWQNCKWVTQSLHTTIEVGLVGKKLCNVPKSTHRARSAGRRSEVPPLFRD